MLYTNRTYEVATRNFDNFTITQIFVGEKAAEGSRNSRKRFLALTCPKGSEVYKGMNNDLTIGKTVKGFPRIHYSSPLSTDLYMLLSSQGGDTTLGNGRIFVQENMADDFEVLGRASGADDDETDSSYDILLLKAPSSGVVRVRLSGNSKEFHNVLYLINKGKVHQTSLEKIEELCAQLKIKVPCEVHHYNSGAVGYGGDWKML